MRDQFYADRKDVWKWTVTGNEARTAGATHILYVALMRPDVDNKKNHSRCFDPVENADPLVVDFFKHEREAFGLQINAQGQPHIGTPRHRRVRRVVRLGNAISLPIGYIGGEYRAQVAHAWFADQVSPWLAGRNRGQPLVVLIDPDTGLSQSADPGDAQVAPAQVQAVCAQMQSRDVLLLYVEPAHLPEAMNAEAARLAGVLGVPPAAVRIAPFPFDQGKGMLMVTK